MHYRAQYYHTQYGYYVDCGMRFGSELEAERYIKRNYPRCAFKIIVIK